MGVEVAVDVEMIMGVDVVMDVGVAGGVAVVTWLNLMNDEIFLK